MTRAAFIFLVDGGASKTEAVLLRPAGPSMAAATVLARHRGPPCNLYQNPDAGLAAIAAGWRACAGPDADSMAGRTCLGAGLAGLSAPGTRPAFFAAFADFAATRLSSDGYTALAGAHTTGPGALLSIGTGTVGCRFDDAGRYHQLGGWGFPVGDAGGGAWLGRRLVAAWLDHQDGVCRADASAALWHTLPPILGATRPDILAWLKHATPAGFAALVPHLLHAAQAGDAVAVALLHRAAAHLALLARALLPSGPTRRITLAGGLAPALTPYLRAALGPDADLVAARPDAPLEGAWHIATGARPPEFTA